MLLPIFIRVDAAIKHFATVVEKSGEAQSPGAGAAGGLGFMAVALLDAEIRSGVDMILDETGGEKLLDEADLVRPHRYANTQRQSTNWHRRARTCPRHSRRCCVRTEFIAGGIVKHSF